MTTATVDGSGPERRDELSSNDRWTLGFIAVGALVALVAARIPALGDGPSLCPLYSTLGLHCPGCGLTRACLSLTKLELLAAVRQNPLVVFIAGYAGYLLFSIAATFATGRRIPPWPRIARRTVCAAFIASWLVLAVVRTVTWVAPETNPDGFLIPRAFTAADH